MLEPLLGALVIFALRIGDVSVGTLRVVLLVSGKKLPATILAFFESAIWIFAISKVFAEIGGNPVKMFAYASGYAAGTLVGMAAEQYMAFGEQLVRVITRRVEANMKELLAAEGFGVTSFSGEGIGGPVEELLIAIPRKRRSRLLQLVRQIDPKAFITVEGVTQIVGGFIPRAWTDHGK